MPLCIPGSRFGDNSEQRLSAALQNFWPILSTLPPSPTNSVPSPPMHVTEVILSCGTFCYQQSERSQRGHNKPLVGINTTIHPSSAALSLNSVVGLEGGGGVSQLPSAERLLAQRGLTYTHIHIDSQLQSRQFTHPQFHVFGLREAAGGPTQTWRDRATSMAALLGRHNVTRGVRTGVQRWQAGDRLRRVMMCQQFPESLFELT